MKIGILGNLKRLKNTEIIDEMHRFLTELGHTTVRFSAPTEIADVDVVIILGGDGAILHAAVTAAKNGIKIIGINYGNLGFLTEYEKSERLQVKEMLTSLEKGTCGIVKRSLLQLSIDNKVFYALNEIAVQRDYRLSDEDLPQILKLELTTKEGKNTISGDGLLVCTPTGSTAYSLSAGGAILMPEVPVFMLTPICAFSMRARPTVVSDNDTFSIKSLLGNAVVLADGKVVASLNENQELYVKKAPFTADFPVRESSDFFAKVRNKLNG